MTLAEAILQIYNGNKFVIDRNIEDLTHDESLLQPEAEANCLNWIVGHIVSNRNVALKMLGDPPVWEENKAMIYTRGSEEITTESDNVVPFPEIKAALDRSQEQLKNALSAIEDDALNEMSDDRSFGQRLLGLAWHETYHAGQTDYSRRLAGKQEGGIR